MRLHDGSLNRDSKQHRCSCGCSQNRRSHSHFHFKPSYQQCARTIGYIIRHEQDLSVDLDQIRWLDTRKLMLLDRTWLASRPDIISETISPAISPSPDGRRLTRAMEAQKGARRAR